MKLNGKIKNGNIKIDMSNNYERISSFGKILNFLWITIATLLPYKLSHKLLVSSKKAEVIKKYSTQYQALEEMYKHKSKYFSINPTTQLDNIWLNQKNPKALRNRLKLFKKIIKIEIDRRENQGIITILSIGSGSARGIIEVINDFEKSNKYNSKLNIILIDRDPQAINYSNSLAKEFGILNSISYVTKDIVDAYDVVRKENPDIIEMVGILDYYKDDKAIQVLNQLHEMISENSVIITCNINKNLEEKFVSKIVKWRMVYRTPREFYNLLNETKFRSNIELIYEPLMVHGIVILKKDNA